MPSSRNAAPADATVCYTDENACGGDWRWVAKISTCAQQRKERISLKGMAKIVGLLTLMLSIVTVWMSAACI